MPSDLLKNIKHTGTGVPASRAFQVNYYIIEEMIFDKQKSEF